MELKEGLLVSSELGPGLLRVDHAPRELAEFGSRKAEMVEIRYFGLIATEIALVLGVSFQAVNRDWNLAKAWLARAVARQERNERPIRRTCRS
jgi:hypothetical protein